MTNKKLIDEFFEKASKKINEYEFKVSHRKKPEDFSRERVLSFQVTVLLLLNIVRKSMSIEVYNFF